MKDRWIQVLWIAQLLFLGSGLVWLGLPDFSLTLVQDIAMPAGPERDAAAVGQAYLGDFALTIGLLTLVALSQKSVPQRRWMAIGFAVYFAIWGAVVGLNALIYPGVTGAGQTIGMVAFTEIVAIGNLLVARNTVKVRPPGTSSRWRPWLAQGCFLLITGLVLLFGASEVASLTLKTNVLNDFARGEFRIAGSYHLALACFSLYGMSRASEWIFRPFLAIFVFFFGVATIITIYVATTQEIFTPWIWVYFIPAAGFAMTNAFALASTPTGFTARRA